MKKVFLCATQYYMHEKNVLMEKFRQPDITKEEFERLCQEYLELLKESQHKF